jgi:cellulose synthase/poly-beta-1,6-N-acetylglucosamine synthase-like glycosyltransferase
MALAASAGLAVVWLVYPGLIWVAGRLVRRPPAGPLTEWPKVSVVLATREEMPLVAERIRNLVATAYPLDRLEIIIAQDGRQAALDLAALPASGAALRLVRSVEPGKAAGLNGGVSAAVGDVIVFADTRQKFEPETIPRLVANVMQDGVGAVTGSYSLAPGSGAVVSLYWQYERWLRRAEARFHSSVGATGAVYAIRRSAWSPLPIGLILDDVYTPMRVVLSGQRVAFAEDARAHETRTPTPVQEYGRKVRTLTGVIQLCAWLPAVLAPVRNPIWLQFVCHKLLRLLTPYGVAVLGIWALAALLTSLDRQALFSLSVVALLAATWVALTRSAWGSRIRKLMVEAVLIQVAVLMAGINGIRGHWQVWDG